MPRLLIADDDAGIRSVLRQSLEDEGYDVDETGNAAGVIAALRAGDGRPDLILMDVRMPDRSGLDVLREAAGKGPNLGQPVVVMTAYSASNIAIEAGAFHNDVVAVANERVLFAHEQAFENREALYAELRRRLPEVEIVEVPASAVSLEDAIGSYLFNSQLVTLPSGEMVLVLPKESEENARVKAWLETMLAGNGPIRGCHFIDVRESMKNGGGPACLRLRVAVSEAAYAAIDPRFLLDDAKADALERLIETHWPESIAPDDLGNPALWETAWESRRALLKLLDL